mgnify:CR=1 FL=1
MCYGTEPGDLRLYLKNNVRRSVSEHNLFLSSGREQGVFGTGREQKWMEVSMERESRFLRDVKPRDLDIQPLLREQTSVTTNLV